MSHIRIEWVGDMHLCPRCGDVKSDTVRVLIDGAPALDLAVRTDEEDWPGHTFPYRLAEVLERVLAHLGHTIEGTK